MLTGNADQQTAIEAVNQGRVFHFLTKPCLSETLALALQAGVKQHRLIIAERELLEQTLNGSVKVLTDILSMADPLSFGQGQSLRDFMRSYVLALRLNQTWEFEIAAMLSQIGMVTIPPPVLQKIRACHRLTGAEQDMLTRVPKIGAELLANIPRLEPVSKIVLYQQKHFDGSGFPLDAVKGDAIPMGSRILKVLSDLLELTTRKTSKIEALNLMRNRRGCYDPRVLEAAFACFDPRLSGPNPVPGQGQAVSAKDLRIGQVLLSDVRTPDDTLIVPAGNRISQMVLEKLANFAALSGLKEPIYVEATPQAKSA
jgi:response regulator RpfG family c-di-GMP phosphodiesterase